MTRSRFSTPRQPRRGFTLIELLVVISIIAVLVSLIAPAVQTARRTAKRMECSNNMRNVGLAMINFATGNNGGYPALSTTLNISNSNGTGTMNVGWPIQILPFLENSALLKNIKNDAVFINSSFPALATINGPDTADGIDDTGWLQVFTCPEDSHAYRRAGGLSYAVNAGFISGDLWGIAEGATASSYHNPGYLSWDGNSTNYDPNDIAIHGATGVIWRSSANYQSSIDYVSAGDGTSTTILLTENLQAGKFYDTDVNSLGFGIRIYAPNYKPTSSDFVFTTGTPPTPTLLTETTQFGNPDTNRPDGWVINRNLGAGAGTSPRPSSNHAGGVNYMMCDGSVKFLGESISKDVYAKLCTSNGVNYGERSLGQSQY